MKVILAAACAAAACTSPTNLGNPGSPAIKRPDVTGTVFTIVFENENQEEILSKLPFFTKLAAENSQAGAYLSTTHPSLPNYIEMTAGTSRGITSDNDPAFNIQIGGTDNLADQLDGAGIAWRAYMESMGTPCNMNSNGLYEAHHNPFIYYTTMVADPMRCADRVVDFDEHFANDVASGYYRYMFIVPNTCNDMHNCDGMIGDAWLERVTTKIMASPAYQYGGALFVLFDEGNTRFLGAGANLATIVASPNLIETGYISNTTFGHASYLATVQDIFHLPRLSTTKAAVPMDEHFKLLSE